MQTEYFVVFSTWQYSQQSSELTWWPKNNAQSYTDIKPRTYRAFVKMRLSHRVTEYTTRGPRDTFSRGTEKTTVVFCENTCNWIVDRQNIVCVDCFVAIFFCRRDYSRPFRKCSNRYHTVASTKSPTRPNEFWSIRFFFFIVITVLFVYYLSS